MPATPALTLVGRSSSHFTRVARVFAVELGVEHAFRPVLDITTLETAAYAGNPSLKVPVLLDEEGPLFGTENICRELARRSGKRAAVVLRGDVPSRRVANAEELTLHVMSSEVPIIMAKMTGNARLAPPKVVASIDHCLRRLDEEVDALVQALPADRALSFVEVALFCVLEHLPFREVMDVSPYARLGDFVRGFRERGSARATEYRFDAGA